MFGDRFAYHRFEVNQNFGPACNFGAQQATTPYVLFLNNDTQVRPGWLAPLVDTMESTPKTGAVGPLLIFPDNRVQHLGVTYYVGCGAAHLFNRIPADHPLAKKQRSLQAITGAALLIRTALFKECGEFHPGYKNGCEDLDLCCQLDKRGLTMHSVPQSVVVHYEGMSRKGSPTENHNFSLFKQRCGSHIRPDIYDHATVEGMEIRFGRPAHIFIAETQATSKRLMAANWDGRNLLRLWEAVERHILWEEGYQMLGSMLEQTQSWDEAVFIRYWQNMFFPRVENAVALHKLARTAGRTDILESAEDLLAMHAGMQNNTAFKRNVLQDHIVFFKARGENEQAAVFERELARLGLTSRLPDATSPQDGRSGSAAANGQSDKS
ncbi:MAG: glycosyltransferase [Desulfovibrio sp.]|uniref:glycosyltransferase n=1 Tax=Desulfovibrio sp. 7SRBS1 TaxID=3378064 RepID=UPI003B424813